VGLLRNPTNSNAAAASRNLVSAAKVLGVQLHGLAVRKPQELEGAFTVITREHLQAVVVVTDGVIFNQRARIAELAAHSRLPTMYESKDFVEAGGLIAYGPSYADLARRAATYVDKVLKGAKPADLPTTWKTMCFFRYSFIH
jgi:putative tryptophan/tyrosine transport system substrate-binding protein